MIQVCRARCSLFMHLEQDVPPGGEGRTCDPRCSASWRWGAALLALAAHRVAWSPLLLDIAAPTTCISDNPTYMSTSHMQCTSSITQPQPLD